MVEIQKRPKAMSEAFRFRRPAEAAGLADALLGRGPFNYRSGLFLAAPRRTGKSTFLQQDLIPELQSRAVTTIYVDLWSNLQSDPAVLITDAIRTAEAGPPTAAKGNIEGGSER